MLRRAVINKSAPIMSILPRKKISTRAVSAVK